MNVKSGRPSDERMLLLRVAEGDHAAFKQLYDRHGWRVYIVSLKMLHRPDLAEEAVQEIFIKIWLLGDKLKEIEFFEAYLRKIARNYCLNVIRRLLLESRATNVLGDETPQSHQDTEESILLRDTRQMIDDVVDTLPERQKIAYRLCHQEGLSYEEAAKRMGISVNTLKTHMKRALQVVRKNVTESP